MELLGQVAVVTGGSRGIGKGIALALAEAGADLVINYRKDEKAAGETAHRIKVMGRKTLAVQGDVSNFETARELMHQAFQEAHFSREIIRRADYLGPEAVRLEGLDIAGE